MSHYYQDNKYLRSSKGVAVLAVTNYTASLLPDLPKFLAKQGTVNS